jgi:serine/threonine protein phosphatase 1
LFESGLKTPRPLVICGHYVQRSLKPYCSSNFVCLDTGCGSVPGAPLSVALLPKREFKMFSGET